MAEELIKPVDRSGTESLKWGIYSPDILPMWVADMDFEVPEPIIEALQNRISHKVFGYGMDLEELVEVVVDRMKELQNWDIEPESVLLLPGLVCGLNIACRVIGEDGDGVLVNTPVYPPFLTAPSNQRKILQSAPQSYRMKDGYLHYDMDMKGLEDAVEENTKLFILCNPHNPTGRVFTRQELLSLAEMCARKNLLICSDEIHNDLLLGDNRHISIASLDPEIADRTMTFIAPSKTYNIPGLGCSAAIIPNRELRLRVKALFDGIVSQPNILGMYAALAAYSSCQEWLDALRVYLTGNRDFMVDFLQKHLPGIRTTLPEATYLAWMDCRDCGIEGNPQKFFLEQARVALNDGAMFGAGGEGFVRLNFGCSRENLEEALNRMRKAMK
ncbi:MAG: PatB family C-S lyase [Acidobacteriota bacterium]